MKLYKLSNDEYIMRENNLAVFFSSVNKMVNYFHTNDLKVSELQYALEEMNKNDHNVSSFGHWKCFLFSEKV